MDLRNLMNDDERDQSRKEGQATSATAPAPPASNAQPATPSPYAHPSQQQQTPLYAPPSAGGIARPSQSQSITPLRTPSQNISSAQYPFPQQAQQSPIGGAPGQHYRPFESQPATNAPRPGSHGHSYQTSQSAAYSNHTPIQQQNSYTSISPTPPSHLSRTPSSLRQSPLATMSHLPSQQHQQQQQFSQPNTPLGPPQHYPQRAPTYSDTQSPYHQRRYSNASNGLVSGSPAQHHPGIPNLVESPNAYARPSPSEYLAQSQRGSRERSISVSPKTKPPPRPPSLSSQHSSNPQEIYSTRSSEQYNSVPLAGSPNHVTQAIAQPQYQSQSRTAAYPNVASEVPHATPTSLPTSSMFPPGAQGSLSSQAGSQAPQPQPPPSTDISHQSQKMGMSHLVTPTSEVPPHVNGNSTSRPAAQTAGSQNGVNIFLRKEQSATSESRPPAVPLSHSYGQMEVTSSEQPNGAVSAAGADIETKPSLKRPASSSNSLDSSEPPAKQVKRKYTQRPIWARLSKHNPRYHDQGPISGGTNGHAAAPPPAAPRPAAPRPAAPRPAAPRTNGGAVMSQPSNPDSGSEPIDTDMMRIRGFLGEWERSFKNSQPLPDTNRRVADWMFTELAQLREVGTDPHYGTVEIEGKIGTLFHKDTGERCSLPVMNTVILNPVQSEQYRFESRMQESEHAHMNSVLNDALTTSRSQHGRVKMRYKHITDIDSFQPLSAAGLAALPPPIRHRVEHGGRPPKLRTTTRHEKGKAPYIAARIVKVNVANLQIYSPNDPYDLRISINVEVNLDRPDLQPEDLVIAAAANDKDGPLPDRKKDRISYSHLAYQIDLTRVDVIPAGAGIGGGGKNSTSNQRPIYELEIEVDAILLREQMRISESGQESGFGDVVAGFWDDAVLLMRERPR